MAERAPRVSVITIVFNGEAYLAEAIESVLAQTMTDWELIVCDDGSTDGSRSIAEGYAERFPGKIRSLNHRDGSNHGMSATRNLGLAQARGGFIGFLDCDDVWEPYKLEQQLALMEANPSVGMLYGRTLIWHSWQQAAAQADHYYDLGVPAGMLYEPPRLLGTLLANMSQSPTTCNALMRADLVARVGGFEEAFPGMFEDQAFFAKLLLVAPVLVAGNSWAKYRQHDQSFSARSARDKRDDAERLRFLAWFAAYALRHRPFQIGVHARIAREIAGMIARRGRGAMRRFRGGMRQFRSTPS
jgi:glycosyltransferase involved in cell wall biosynthesis